MTSRPDELWIVEVDQTGHETWSSLEDFLHRFCPPVDQHLMQHWAHSWREHYDIPLPSTSTSSDSQFPVLPQPNHARATAAALLRGYPIIATFFSPAGDVQLIDFHKVILLLFFNQWHHRMIPSHISGTPPHLPTNLNRNHGHKFIHHRR